MTNRSYQEYSTPVDVTATREDLAADRSVAVPSRVRDGMSLSIRYELQTSIELDKFHHLRPVGE